MPEKKLRYERAVDGAQMGNVAFVYSGDLSHVPRGGYSRSTISRDVALSVRLLPFGSGVRQEESAPAMPDSRYAGSRTRRSAPPGEF
jgi:hypothetical protein